MFRLVTFPNQIVHRSGSVGNRYFGVEEEINSGQGASNIYHQRIT